MLPALVPQVAVSTPLSTRNVSAKRARLPLTQIADSSVSPDSHDTGHPSEAQVAEAKVFTGLTGTAADCSVATPDEASSCFELLAANMITAAAISAMANVGSFMVNLIP